MKGVNLEEGSNKQLWLTDGKICLGKLGEDSGRHDSYGMKLSVGDIVVVGLAAYNDKKGIHDPSVNYVTMRNGVGTVEGVAKDAELRVEEDADGNPREYYTCTFPNWDCRVTRIKSCIYVAEHEVWGNGIYMQ